MFKDREICNNRKATSLIEIMLAVFIMALAMIPIAGVMGTGGKATMKDARRIVAIQILNKTMKALLRTDYSKIPIGNNIKASIASSDVALGKLKGSNGYEYILTLKSEYINPTKFTYARINVNRPGFSDTTILPSDFTGNATISLNSCVKKLQLTVQWKEQGNKLVSVSAITYRANFERAKI